MRKSLNLTLAPRPPRQLCIALDPPELWGIKSVERSAVTTRLARLLLEAAGMLLEESRDD